MIRAAVVGANGYAGAELVRILSGHPDVELTAITSRQYAGNAFDSIYPALSTVVDLNFIDNDTETISKAADVVFLALPHKASMGMAPALLDAGLRVVDLSADFRFHNQAAYEAHYQPHSCADRLPQAVYGLCEVYGQQVAGADLIGNPGCYPTSVLLPLLPVVKAGLIDPATIIADCKSGVSGAGRGATATTHFCHVNESFKPYKVGGHRHTPEIEEKLSDCAGKPVRITFTPHLVPMTRGMQSSIYATLAPGVDAAQVRSCLETAYAGRPFVRLLPDGRWPDTLHVKGTNFCDIGWAVDPGTGRLILLSAIDNLVKGAAGQAVQNMNLMVGLDETVGLDTVPFPL
ncbi:N-acetyl-gamma-glutamyl-phosphate reductase [Desulfosarcina ovata subsp. sediminis]|uniref:N-acetyl-gamma-glutamyl-phosphate reductase n=1 Tax=Desulfosarcina ovata subsp. sediminis TaxID=885957 RepID=A0A5K7ZI66_9BACT|nr:N-acetyl-gamma-glutamyl-phosphate reductase [Desulfosarcina ovata]BBO80561.1 N-acetyl-gamma-glutamyl-phosphate reductase [Desulfosarcina ovata subsp. sediminis]